MYEYICINFCAVVECGNRSDREKEISFNHLPAVISVKVQKTPHELTKKKGMILGSQEFTGKTLDSRSIPILVSALYTSYQVI